MTSASSGREAVGAAKTFTIERMKLAYDQLKAANKILGGKGGINGAAKYVEKMNMGPGDKKWVSADAVKRAHYRYREYLSGQKGRTDR